MLATWRYTARAIIHSYAHRSSSSLKNYLKWLLFKPKLGKTNTSKADLHVFSKLFADGLERGQEAKALSGRQIGGHDDVLDFVVGHLINVDMTRQPAP